MIRLLRPSHASIVPRGRRCGHHLPDRGQAAKGRPLAHVTTPWPCGRRCSDYLLDRGQAAARHVGDDRGVDRLPGAAWAAMASFRSLWTSPA